MSIVALLLVLAVRQVEPKPITVVGSAWAPFISPMGEPFRSRAAGDDTLLNWFGGADKNADSNLNLAEMEADASRFFATLDEDGDKQILPGELALYESQIAPEIQVNSRWRDPRGEGKSTRDSRRSGYDPRGLQGAARYTLLNIPQPVAAADTDLNRAITIEEFRRAAAQRFQLLDKNSDGRLDLAELRTQLPPARKDHRPGKIDKEDYRDPRIGNSVPVED